VDLAQLTGLTTPAIANITNRLLQENLIQEVGKLQGRRGHPAMRLAINPDGCFSFDVNIDRDHVTLVSVSRLVNPKAIFIGGRLPLKLLDRLADHLNQQLKRRASDVSFVARVARCAGLKSGSR
jgi:hypothetical protein